MRVFISYRRENDIYRATMLRQMIESVFRDAEEGTEMTVYQDVRQRVGVDWPQEIVEAVTKASAVLVVIGPEWLLAKDRYGRRRIDQEDDWVRREIELALGQEKLVYPITFDVDIPPEEALPSSIRELAKRRAVSVRSQNADEDLQPILLELLNLARDLPVHSIRRATDDEFDWPEPPLPVIPSALSEEDVDVALNEMLDGWTIYISHDSKGLAKARQELYKRFNFDTFPDAIAFMVKASRFIEKVNHHPRWENVYRNLDVYLSTWDAGHVITFLDIQLAMNLDQVHVEYVSSE